MKKPSIISSDFVLGALIAILSILTAFTGWEFSKADGASSGFSSQGMLKLTDANAEYLVANQNIIQDYTYYDTYYLNVEAQPDIADYFKSNFSDALTASLERDTPFDEQYYEEMYQVPHEMFAEADALFAKASEGGNRTDRLQLVSLVYAVAISFTAWASLLDKQSKMRLVFSVMALLVMIAGIVVYITAPILIS
jgi:hypothetical protein